MKAALIGTGQIARQHLACLRGLPDVQVVGVCDLSSAKAQYAAERFSIPAYYTDSGLMLSETQPDVVHITTPPSSHYALAMAALDARSHVIVEKPVALRHSDVQALFQKASERGLAIVEDQNYIFNRGTQKILNLIASGDFGDVTHVEVFLCLDILAPGSVFCDPNVPHSMLKTPGGAIADFLPHLASLAYVFIGEHHSARALWSKRSSSPLPSDEFRAVIAGERGSATLAFSANTRPDAFWLRVYGTKMQAVANLFETRLTTNRVHSGPKPLIPFWNAIHEARDLRKSAFNTFLQKLNGGPGSYEGLWTLLTNTYESLRHQVGSPVPINQVLAVSRLVSDLIDEGARL